MQLSMQFLPVRRSLSIENDEIYLDIPVAPIRMCMESLLHQSQVLRVVHPHQENGIVAGDAKAPQPRLSLSIRREGCRLRAQRGPGIKQNRQELLDALQVCWRQVELNQFQFRANASLIKDAHNRPSILVAAS